jgi:hypothetical protein
VCILGGGFGGLYTAVKLQLLMWPKGKKPQVRREGPAHTAGSGACTHTYPQQLWTTQPLAAVLVSLTGSSTHTANAATSRHAGTPLCIDTQRVKARAALGTNTGPRQSCACQYLVCE